MALNNKVAIVTGASRNIGRAIAVALGSAGLNSLGIHMLPAVLDKGVSPATGAARSVLTRQVTLAGPKKPSSSGVTGTAAAYAAADRWTSPAASA